MTKREKTSKGKGKWFFRVYVGHHTVDFGDRDTGLCDIQMWWMDFYQISSKDLDELSVWVSFSFKSQKAHILTTSMWQLPSFSCWFGWQSFKWRKRKSHVQPRRNCHSSSRIKEYNIIMVLFCYLSTCKTADFPLALTLFAVIAIETYQGRWTHAPLLLFVWIKIHPPVTLYWISRRK